MDSATNESVPPGELVTFSARDFVYVCNNESLGQGKPNYMKNPNTFDREIACSFAESVEMSGATTETTLMVLSPSSREYEDPSSWLSCTLKALESLPEDHNQRVDMESRIKALQTAGAKPTWEQTIQATLWDYSKDGALDEDFNKKRPEFVTVQGQHRAAILNAALGPELGLSTSRAGDLGDGLFDHAERQEKMKNLRNNLQGMKLSVNVYDFLTHDKAENVGARQRTAEKTSTDVSFMDIAESMGALVKQLFNPGAAVCRERADEVFGEGWVKKLTLAAGKQDAAGMKKKLVEKINRTLQNRLDLKPGSSNVFVACVYGFALCPERRSLQILRDYFNDQNSKIIKAKAAEVRRMSSGKPPVEKEANDSEKTSLVKDPRHGINVNSMGAFFSLTEYSQESQAVHQLLWDGGLSEEFRKKCIYHFTVLEVVRAMTIGLVRRLHCTVDPFPYKDKDPRPTIPAGAEQLYGLLRAFVSEEEAAVVAGEGPEFIRSIREEVDHWVIPLVGLALKRFGPYLTGELRVSKRALQSSLNRRVDGWKGKGGVSPSNQSKLQPGFGLEPHMSTDGTEPEYTTRTWDDWFVYQTGESHGNFNCQFEHRMLATVFALLIVDRILVRLRSKHDHLPDRLCQFHELVQAIPEKGWGRSLKEALKSPAVRGKLLVDGQCFFDGPRMDHLGGVEQGNGEGDDLLSDNREGPPKYFDLSITDGDNDRDSDEDDGAPTKVRWTSGLLKRLGLLGDDGEIRKRSGTFRFDFANESERDTANKKQKSGKASNKRPATPISPTEQQRKKAAKKGKEKSSGPSPAALPDQRGGSDKDKSGGDDHGDSEEEFATEQQGREKEKSTETSAAALPGKQGGSDKDQSEPATEQQGKEKEKPSDPSGAALPGQRAGRPGQRVGSDKDQSAGSDDDGDYGNLHEAQTEQNEQTAGDISVDCSEGDGGAKFHAPAFSSPHPDAVSSPVALGFPINQDPPAAPALMTICVKEEIRRGGRVGV